ncbi:MAG: hypothetical protein GJ680_18200 [Alteromonadaceae bacterium]|nr:hypothetical protein [Alteromonadaceae bacterium]
MYFEKFHEASKRSLAFGVLENNVIGLCTERFLENESVLERVLSAINAETSHLTPEEISATSFGLHTRLCQAIALATSIPIYLTIGYVSLQGQKLFYTSEEALKSYLGGRSPQALNLHTWLTLPSMEIIDVTLSTSIGLNQREPELFGNIVTKHPDELSGGLAYHPQLLGIDYFDNIGATYIINSKFD